MAGIDCIVHCAARTHVMKEKVGEPLALYSAVNVAATKRLAKQAAVLGVRRLVFLSSVMVNGERTVPGAPFIFSDTAAPEDDYAVSKWEAEQALWDVSRATSLEVVIIRLPLVYGHGVKGNFLHLLKLTARGIPLPLGGIDNRRSLMGLDNLVDLLILCVVHPAAAGQTFLVSDGEDLSTPALVRSLAQALGRRPRLFSMPLGLLRLGGSLTGRIAQVECLVGTLQVDIAHTCKVLDWKPWVSVEEGLLRTVVYQCRKIGYAR